MVLSDRRFACTGASVTRSGNIVPAVEATRAAAAAAAAAQL